MTTSSSSSPDHDLVDIDLYHLLDPTSTLTATSAQTDIARHYRKQARLLHPDKNPNNPNAAQQFDTLQRAYQLLSDETRRTEYNERIRKREEKKRKAGEEDVRVRRMRERLEEREREGRAGWESSKRQAQAVRIQRENEAVIQQLRRHTQPSPLSVAQQRTEGRREERRQEEAKEDRSGDTAAERGGSTGTNGTGTDAGLDMKAYETSTLERMREMARRKKQEREKQQQRQKEDGDDTQGGDSNNTATASLQQEREVIVLDDGRDSIT